MQGGTRGIAGAVVALAVGVGGVVLGGPASATPVVGCGAVVEGEAVLTADLICRKSPVGLTLLDGASLDLNGFRIVGGGAGTGLIVPPDGSVEIRGGVIRGWAKGVALHRGDEDEGWAPAGNLRIEGVTFRENTTGLEVEAFAIAGPHTRVTSSTFVGNDQAIYALELWGGPELTITASRFTDNGGGISLELSRATIVDSVFAFNQGAVGCSESYCRIEDSTLRDNGTAIWTYWYGYASVHRSTIARNDVGLNSYWVENGPNEIVDSTLSDNGTAVRLYNARGALTGNRFLRNDVGFEVLGDAGLTASLVDNEFRRNGDGVLSVIEGSTLQGNTAVSNERWGIHAPGAVDLGGNTARGNGNEPQCVGVVCARTGPRS